MPLLKSETTNFVQIQRVYIDSRERTQGNNARYTVNIPGRHIDNVVAMEMTNFSFPNASATPFTGRDQLDFSLLNVGIFATPKAFTVELPANRFLYSTSVQYVTSYIDALQIQINNEIAKDPDFGGRVDVIVVSDPSGHTHVVCRTLVYPPLGTWPGFGSTTMTFQFSSGPNAASSPAIVMGFPDGVDQVFAADTHNGVAVTSVRSDDPAQLDIFRSIDIFIKEAQEFKPFFRVFLRPIREDTGEVVLSNFQEPRVRLMTQPVSRLKQLEVKLLLSGQVEPVGDLPHFFTLDIFFLSNDIVLPAYASRTFFV